MIEICIVKARNKEKVYRSICRYIWMEIPFIGHGTHLGRITRGCSRSETLETLDFLLLLEKRIEKVFPISKPHLRYNRFESCQDFQSIDEGTDDENGKTWRNPKCE